MFNKFFNFLRGYVIINVYGKQTARFLNICIRRGMRVFNTRPVVGGIELSMANRDFFAARPVARKCRVKIRIKEKCGFKHMSYLYRKRYAFLAAAILCAVLCFLSTRFIWLVEINGASDDKIESITSTLDEIGVKRGGLKSKLPDGMELKRRIINGTDNIAWAWVYIEGAKARVEIYEQIVPPVVIDKSEPCDIVAVCGGVIRDMTVKSGEERFKAGDAVSAGDVLVSGRVPAYKEGYAEEYIHVHAIATVNAYTTHNASGDYKLYYESRKPTGRHKKLVAIDLFGKAFMLPLGDIKYEDYDRQEKRAEINIPFFGYSGIAIDTVSYSEVVVNREPMPIETALDLAKNDLEEKIAKELTNGSELTDENIEYEQTDDETIKVTLKMNFIENIAAPQPLGTAEDKGEEILDNETDRGAAGA